MHLSRTLLLSTLAMMCAACNGPASTDDTDDTGKADGGSAVITAGTLGDQVVLPVADYLKLPQYKNADAEYGQGLAMQCLACHSFEKGAPSPVGPNLQGFFGRPVAAVDGYPYSPALREADFIWTPLALDAWLAQPARFLPGNRMVYAGLKDQDDRNAVIAALLRLTATAGTVDGN